MSKLPPMYGPSSFWSNVIVLTLVVRAPVTSPSLPTVVQPIDVPPHFANFEYGEKKLPPTYGPSPLGLNAIVLTLSSKPSGPPLIDVQLLPVHFARKFIPRLATLVKLPPTYGPSPFWSNAIV